MFARLRPIGFVALLLTQATVAPVRATALDLPGLPDAAALRALVAAAEGPTPESERLVETYNVGGLIGRTVVVRHSANERSDDVYGALRTSAGIYNGLRWHQNANGETVLEQPDPGRVVVEPAKTSVSLGGKPASDYVIAELDAHGYGTRQYVDMQTYRITRDERVAPGHTIVTTYDDFRTVEGRTRAWHWTIRDGRSEDDADYRIVSADLHVDEAKLRIPPSRRILVEFPSGKTAVDLPVREWEGRFIVRVQIGSRGLDFQLDTGAAGIMLDDDVARELALPRFGEFSSGSITGTYHHSLAIVPEMSVGELKMHDVAVTTIPHVGGDVPKYFRVVGLLGFDFIGDVGLAIDYEHERVTATSPESFAPPKDRRALVLYVRLGNGQPQTNVMIEGALGERFLIDTGASGDMFVFDSFARRHPEALRDALYVEDQPRFIGVGGEVRTSPYRCHSVRVGDGVFKDLIAYRVPAAQSSDLAQDGVLGAGFLKYFTLYIDYSNSMVYLVPNDRAGALRT